MVSKFLNVLALASVAQLVGALFCSLKGQGFDSQSRHNPRSQARSPVGAIDVSLSC